MMAISNHAVASAAPAPSTMQWHQQLICHQSVASVPYIGSQPRMRAVCLETPKQQTLLSYYTLSVIAGTYYQWMVSIISGW